MGQEKKYSLKYHAKVFGEVAALDSFWRGQIKSALEEKLLVRPELFGKPLRQSLSGCRSLRVGDYRIVYQIEKKAIYILAVVHRSNEYKGIEKRI